MIEQKLYNKILENIPIICVDGIIQKDGGEFLLIKRKNEPEKDKWWFPGGRLLKGERLEDAVIRKIKEETNIDTNVICYIGTTQTIFDVGVNNIPTHTVNFTFLLNGENVSEIDINKDHSEYYWFKKAPEDLHTELKKILNKVI